MLTLGLLLLLGSRSFLICWRLCLLLLLGLLLLLLLLLYRLFSLVGSLGLLGASLLRRRRLVLLALDGDSRRTRLATLCGRLLLAFLWSGLL